jgi:K+-sensing histidine kinase KdpD
MRHNHTATVDERSGTKPRKRGEPDGRRVRGGDFDEDCEPRFARGTGQIERVKTEQIDAAASNEALEQIVHDLKNPLATIALETCLLDETLASLADTGPRAAVARITRNVAYLERMVHDLLDSCSIDAGRFELQRRPTELRALLERVVDRVVATRDLGRVKLAAPTQLTLSIDEFRIERVVANLVQNALKYSPRSSPIVIRLEVGRSAGRIAVSDAGPGMTAAETAVVFDKYRRTTFARMQEGSGLGLFVSKQIVAAHGGTIGVDSVCGIGSCFYFDLPIT